MTKLLGIIGSHPSKYSPSPDMWNALMRHLGIDGVYEPWNLGENNEQGQQGLKRKIEELRANPDFLGCNVTIPYKEAVVKHLDTLTTTVSQMGVVNTIRKTNDLMQGYNTDGYGLVGSLKEARISPKDKYFLITGAGGATPAIAFTLAMEGARKICIHNRTREKATKLAESVSKLKSVAYGGGLGDSEVGDELDRALAEADIIINTTDLGMNGDKENMTSLSKEKMSLAKKKAVFVDIVYTPLKTLFLRQAEELGHRIVFGDRMLLWQAVKAAEIIFDRKLGPEDVGVMSKALEDYKRRHA